MQPLATTDRALLATLLPLCCFVYGLHLWSVLTRDLASNSIYAAPASAEDAYPTVGGFYPESREAGIAFERGDRLIRVGDRDLSGVGYAEFDGLLLERTGPARWVEVEYERGGERRVGELRAIPYPLPWHRTPMIVSLFCVGLVVMLRGRDRRQARLVFAGFIGLSFVLAQFRGGPAWITELGLMMRFLGAPMAFGLVIAAMSTVPDARGQPSKAVIGLAIASGAFSLLMRASYHFEFPLSSEMAPRGALLSDVAFIVIALCVPRWRAFPAKVPIACALAAVPMIVGSIIPVIQPDTHLASPLHAVGYFALALIPIVLASRMVTHQLFDVDRVLSAAATYTLIVTIAFAALLGLMPSLALAISALTGVSTGVAQALSSAALALALIPGNRWLRPRVEAFFFPERQAFAAGIERLRARLETCESAAGVLTELGVEIDRLLRLSRSIAYLKRANEFYECFSNVAHPEFGDARRFEAIIDAETPTRALSGLSSAVSLRGSQQPPFDETYRHELVELGFHVLLPIQRSGELEGFLCLGEKGSGGEYSEVELSLLTAAADRAAARLEAFAARRLANEVDTVDPVGLARSGFMARASHDLRQPIHALSLFAAALAQRSHDASISDLARNIGRSTEALREMFDGLLDLSRIELGSLEPKLVKVDLQPLFERLASELGAMAVEKGLSLKVPKTTLSVESDAGLLGRIVQNLVLNALRYTDRGAVVLGARRRGDEVRIEVLDSGPGISAADQQAIFREFARVRDDERESDEGLGLGLAIVDRLADLLGHRVEVDSEVGRGSRFTVIAKRSRQPWAPASAGRPADSVQGLAGRAVLVIDDDPSVREATSLLLETWGCRVAAIATPEEIPQAIEEFQGHVDAVIADYRLERDVTGIDVIRALRAEVGREVPAMLITGDAVGPHSTEAAGLPVLAKPLAPARFRSMLVHLLNRPDSRSPLSSRD